jgi:hypothetical protein
MIGRTLAGLALACAVGAAPLFASAADNVPPGGKYHTCSGQVLHVSTLNIRVHCTEGNPVDLSFLSWPKVAHFSNGKTIQSELLQPGTPVFVVFTQSLGMRQATDITVYNPQTGQAQTTLK